VLNPSKSEFQWNQPFATSAKSSFFSGHDFTGCGKTPSGGRPGIYPRHNSIHEILEINPRGEAALQLFDIRYICHPERSAAESKDLHLFFVAL
jgi:hypothetical protein